VTSDRIAPQPVTLDVRPIEWRELDRDALARANGRDPSRDRLAGWLGFAAVLAALAAVIRCLT